MRTLFGFCIVLLSCTCLIAQNRSGFVTPIPGRPVFGGTPALPGVQRTVGSVVHPGGSSPQIGIPGIRFQGVAGQNLNRGVRPAGSAIYAYPMPYPVYVGGGYGNGYYDAAAAAPVQQQAQQPNVIVIYPSAQAGYPAYTAPAMVPQSNMIDVPQQQLQAPEQTEATHYLLAFKDHSIYSAVAYWVDGDTLHYFTSGNTHNQVSLSLVDRDLTKRLNEGSGLDVKLPTAK